MNYQKIYYELKNDKYTYYELKNDKYTELVEITLRLWGRDGIALDTFNMTT